jgi:hypothetical protein
VRDNNVTSFTAMREIKLQDRRNEELKSYLEKEIEEEKATEETAKAAKDKDEQVELCW